MGFLESIFILHLMKLDRLIWHLCEIVYVNPIPANPLQSIAKSQPQTETYALAGNVDKSQGLQD